MTKQKTMLVTGSGKGLGKALAMYFGAHGYRLIAHYRRHKPVPAFLTVQADLTNENDVKAMFQAIYKRVLSIDVLVNNVGDFIVKDIGHTSFQEFKNVIESNLYSAFLCSQAVLPRMRGKKSGIIINLGCAGAETITIRKKTTPYYIAKTGVIMLTKVLAAKNQAYGIRINSISPGILENSVLKPVPRSQEIRFHDIISAIEFLLSDKAKKITGANLEVANGWIPGFG